MRRLVLIEWEDSFGCSTTWTPVEDCNPIALLCQSVGWLLYEGDDMKVVAPHMTMNTQGVVEQACGDMTIPASAVRRIVDLEMPLPEPPEDE